MPGKKITWFVLAITTLLFSFYIGTYHLDDLPAFFIPGEGVTPIKQVIEYIIFTINLLTAAWLFYRGNKQENPKDIWLAATCGIMGLSELAFTTYINSSEFLNVFGHIYKASAYALLYRVIVFNSIQAPYTKLEATNKKIKQQEQVFRNLINNLPIDIIQIDAEQRIQFISKRFTENFCLKNEQPFNKNWQACTPEAWHHDLSIKLMAPQNAAASELRFNLLHTKSKPHLLQRYRHTQWRDQEQSARRAGYFY